MKTITEVRKGQRVHFKPEWSDVGDDKKVFLAIQDSAGGNVLVQIQSDLTFKQTQTVLLHMIESVSEVGS